MISSMAIWPIIAALMGAIGCVHQDVQPIRAWDLITAQPVTQVQKDFLYRYNPMLGDLELFKPGELRTWASANIEWLNRILEQEGFSIRLNPCPFGVVAIMDIAVQWEKAGSVTSLVDVNDVEYAAFALDKGFSIHQPSGYAHPVICINTQTEDTVWITVADEPVTDMALLDKINQIRTSPVLEYARKCDKVIIPMINYDETAELDWLRGLAIGKYHIDQAKQQTKFKMNESGARAQSAAAFGMRCCITHDVTIDTPFFVWIERPGMHEPLFVGYMDQQYWKNPSDINA
jgi:hypothetical protein